MKRQLIASVALAGLLSTIGSSLAMRWETVAPNAAQYCAGDDGNYAPYIVSRQNGVGEAVQLVFGGLAQRGLCGTIKGSR